MAWIKMFLNSRDWQAWVFWENTFFLLQSIKKDKASSKIILSGNLNLFLSASYLGLKEGKIYNKGLQMITK